MVGQWDAGSDLVVVPVAALSTASPWGTTKGLQSLASASARRGRTAQAQALVQSDRFRPEVARAVCAASSPLVRSG